MVEENLVEEDSQVGGGEEDVEETDHRGQQVLSPPVFLVELVEMFAVQEYDGEEPDHGHLMSSIIITRNAQTSTLQVKD